MSGTLNVFNLGAKGVNLDKSPIHKEDGELLLAQNGQVDSVGALGGLRCRDGMTKLNAVALAGAVRGFIGLPLPDQIRLTRHFYQPVDDNGGAESSRFRTSTDGTTWATTSAIVARPLQFFGARLVIWWQDYVVWSAINNKMYYPGNDYSKALTEPPTIHAFDGANDFIVATIPINPNSSVALGANVLHVCGLIPYQTGTMLVSTYDDSSGMGRGRMFVLNVATGQLTQLGPQSDISTGVSVCPIVWQGKIWWLGFNNGGGTAAKAYWIRPGDTTWTLDAASIFGSALVGYTTGAAVYKGELYMGSAADVGGSALLRKRSTAGAYSTIRTSTSALSGNTIGPLIVSRDGASLFFHEALLGVGTAGTTTANDTRILKYDGTTVTTEYDIGNQLNNAYHKSGMPVMDRRTGDIYWSVDTTDYISSKLLKRTNAGVWSIVDGNVNHLSDGHPARGQFMYIDY